MDDERMRSWLEGGGEMAGRIRAHDWSATPLGAIENWPPSLRTVVDLLLASGFPTIALWGQDLIQVYNDGYRDLMGVKHPGGLGQPTRDCWPEVWHINAPIYARVRRGETLTVEDGLYPITRSGPLEDAWFTLAYSPLRDDGAIAGVLVTVIETTRAVLARAQLRESEARQGFLLDLSDALRPLSGDRAIAAEASRLLGEHLGADRTFLTEVDPDGVTLRVREQHLRSGASSVLGTYSFDQFGASVGPILHAGHLLAVEDVAARSDLDAAQKATYAAIGIAAYLLVPLIRGGRLAACLTFNHRTPRVWSDADRSVALQAADRIWADIVRARAEASLRTSETRFRAFVTARSDAIYRMNADWSEMCRFDGRAFLGGADAPCKNWMDRYVHPDDRPVVRAAIDRAVRDGSVFELEHRVIRADGSLGWTSSRAVPILSDAGEVTEWLGTASDVTAARAARSALRRSEALRRIAMEGGGMGAWRWDLRERLVWGDPRFLALWGLPPSGEAHPLSLFRDRMSSSGASEMDEMVTRATAAGEEFDGQLEVVAGPTMGRWVRWRGRADLDDPSMLHGVSFDVTEQRRSETALRESEAKYRTLFESMTEGYAIGELLRDATGRAVDWRFIAFNPALERHTGMDRAAATGRWFGELFPGADRSYWLDVYQWVVDTQSERAFEAYWPPLDRWLGGVAWPAGDGRFYIFYQDVSERKRAEMTLRESEARLRTLVEGVPQAVWRATGSGAWTWSSPQWAAYTGLSDEASRGEGWLAALHPDDRAPAKASWNATAGGEPLEMEARVRHAASGAYRWFQIRALPVRDGSGGIQEWLGTSTDIQDLKALQERQDVLVAELQHRTRNLIAVVRGIADETMDETGPTEAFRAAFFDRLSALSRVQGLLSRAEAEPIAIGALVRLELDALGTGAPDGRALVEGPEVFLEPSIVQTLALALHELATNARKHGAMSHEGGRLAVTWRERAEGGEARLALDWVETGLAAAPGRRDAPRRDGGYGRELIEHALPHALGARTRYALTDDGVRCSLDIPVRPGRGGGGL